MEDSKDDIMRVVMSERSYAVNKAKLEQYKDTGFEYYKYKAAIGQNRTCERCWKIDKESEEKPIKLREAVEGENLPPIHPNCKCTIIPVMNDNVKIITKKDDEEFEKFKDSGLDTFDHMHILKEKIIECIKQGNLLKESKKVEYMNIMVMQYQSILKLVN